MGRHFIVLAGLLLCVALANGLAVSKGLVLGSTCSKSHKIVSGDTCYDIAKNNNISLQDLINANPGLNCDNLQIGAVLCLCPKTHVVVSGDTCYDIASKNGISLQNLLDANPGINCDNLALNSVLCIPTVTPTTTTTVGPTPTPTPSDCANVPTIVSKTVFTCAFSDCNSGLSDAQLCSLNRALQQLKMTDASSVELSAMLAHMGHESGCLKQKVENACVANPNACTQYDNGDWCTAKAASGKHYYGRGYLQLSWQCNYDAAGKALGLDLLADPDMVANSEDVSFSTAVWFWWANGCRSKAQSGLFSETTRIINGALECNGGPGSQSQASRVAYYNKIRQCFGLAAETDNSKLYC
eukprot:Colp12_sorted_trinity150504_noHs@29037